MLLLEQVKKTYLEPNGEALPILDIERLHIERAEQVVLVVVCKNCTPILFHGARRRTDLTN